jgi:uncharacterized protein (TIGR03118 family)
MSRNKYRFGGVIFMAGALVAQTAPPNKYLVHNLVSDLPGIADHQDSNLQNAWGSGFANQPFWIGNNGTGTSTLYDGYGNKVALTVAIPSAGGGATGGPVTGVIASASAAAFNTGGKPSSFIFCAEDGVISGWNGGSAAAVLVDNSKAGAVYKGCALMANTPIGPALYAANFNSGKIDAWDGKLNASPFSNPNAFVNSAIPAGFAPFNIQAIGTYLYVTYARQNGAKHDDVAGAGNGYLAMFDSVGNLVGNLVAKGPLNSPWGMAMAPATFGAFPNALLVGNFGDGAINAFQPITGALLGTLSLVDAKANATSISGLWSLNFGSGAQNEDPGTLYFTAGPGGGPNNDPLESHGLLGSISPVPSVKANGLLNAASSLSGPISANSFVTISGNGLSPVTGTAQVSGATLPTQLNGVGVTVNGEPAFVSFIGNTQINFLVPADVQLGPAQVVVSDNGIAGAPVSTTVVPATPGFFVIGSANGNAYIAAEHADGSLIGPASLLKGVTTSGAKAGDTIQLFGTGFGSTSPAAPAGQQPAAALPLSHPPSVVIGGVPATVTFAGLIAAGLYQINVMVPAGLTPGDASVIAFVGNAATQEGAFITIGQ